MSNVKVNAETALWKEVLTQYCAKYLGMEFDEVSIKSFTEKVGKQLQSNILNAILLIKEQEVGDNLADRLPADEYKFMTLANKRSIKKDKKSKPKKKKIIIANNEAEAEVSEAEVEVSEAELADDKPKPKKNVCIIQRNAKMGLFYLLNRFMYETVFTQHTERVASDDDYDKLMFEKLTGGHHECYAYRVIIPIVRQYRHLTEGMEQDNFDAYLRDTIGLEAEPYDVHKSIINCCVNYMNTFMQILGVFIGQELWVKKHAVNLQTLERVLRMMSMNNAQYMRQHDLINDNAMGLYSGLIPELYEFQQSMTPVKKPAEKVPVKEVAPKKTKGRKPKKVSKPVIESDSEPEEEQEETVTYDNSEPEEEPEPEPESKPKKTRVRKLKKKKKRNKD